MQGELASLLIILTSARIVLFQELLQALPATSDSNHDRATKNADQTKFLLIAEPVLPLGNLMNGKFAGATTTVDLLLNDRLNFLRFRQRFVRLALASFQRVHEVLVADQPMTFDHVEYKFDLPAFGNERRFFNTFDKLIGRQFVVSINVLPSPQVQHSSFRIMQPRVETFLPIVPIELSGCLRNPAMRERDVQIITNRTSPAKSIYEIKIQCSQKSKTTAKWTENQKVIVSIRSTSSLSY